jgi:AAA+ superfamily predicted ATPase
LEAERRASSQQEGRVLLLLDEADALAASRDAQQMHYEDKAGLNTLLQRLDNLRLRRLPLAAMFVTNRPEALDPAVRRRAALDLRFERPNDEVRAKIVRNAAPELGLTETQVEKLVDLTGPEEPKNSGVPFTSSDLTDRLLPGALRAAYRDGRALSPEDLVNLSEVLVATPPFGCGP